ncbi:MAG: hypothetical protein U0R70_11280 [Solirubrobacteraceae bacterium]
MNLRPDPVPAGRLAAAREHPARGGAGLRIPIAMLPAHVPVCEAAA